MNKYARTISLVLCIAGVLCGQPAGAKMSIKDSKHNLSRSGPGQIKSLTEERICVFCHTPHNASPLSPLWNKDIAGINYALYSMYSSSSMVSAPPSSGPQGASRLCLSCHDGTIALGAVLQPAGGIAMTVPGGIPVMSSSNFGTNLDKHHPVSFSYYDAKPGTNPELVPDAPATDSDLLFYGNGFMECATCHDPHDNSNKKFLRVPSSYSALCTRCHSMTGWTGSSHNTSGNTWNGAGDKPWPRTGPGTDFPAWTSVDINGCESCHTPHNAGGPKRLLNYQAEESNCYPCHNGNVATKNIYAQFQKTYKHDVANTTIGVPPNWHETNESPFMITGHVECVDCHNPHSANNTSTTLGVAPLPGSLSNVTGVDIGNAPLVPPTYASNEYEICFKCHADATWRYTTSYAPIPRVVNTINMLQSFQTGNPSYHPVTGVGKSTSVPSLVGALANLTELSVMYCTDCHDSDESRSIGGTGPRGPHGSQYSPLIRERYETADNTLENPSSYALCYRCHNRTSILQDDSFKKSSANKGGHSGHLGSTVNAPCSACHDPHGVTDDGMVASSHTHLMNFDTRYVTAMPGKTFPYYTDFGSHSGSCTLVCHGISHDGSTKYSYGSNAASGVQIHW